MDKEVINPRLAYFKNRLGDSVHEMPSGASGWLKGIFREVEADRLVAEFVVREDMTNPMKTLHGGAAAMIMDDMMGMLVYLQGYEYAHTSVNINCDFLNPAKLGSRLVSTAIVVRKGRNVVHCECEIIDSDQRLIAKSSSNLIITPIPLQSPV
jgi:acyl-coenzyme A thioesterase 13